MLFRSHDSRTPFRTALVAVAANLVFNILITIPWARAGYIAPHAGLALSTSLASFVNAWQLYRGLRKAGVYTPTHGWAKLFMRVAAANLAMGCVLFFFAGNLDQWMARGALHRVEHLALWMLAAMAMYFGTLFLLGFRINDLRVKGTHLPSGATPV